MKEMMDAAKQINKILHECEENGDNVDTTLGKISAVKVHGVVFPRLMLVELIGEFAEKLSAKSEPDMQSSFDEAQRKWSDTLN